MRDLTLDQVRDAGVFAYLTFREWGLGGSPGERGPNVVIWDPIGKRVVHLHTFALWPTMAQNELSLGMIQRAGLDLYDVSPSVLGGRMPGDGWRHIEPCGCPYCGDA